MVGSESAAMRAKARLPNLDVLRVGGAGAQEFLHGQFTADLRRLPVGDGGFAAWCNPQGRVLFLFDVLRTDPDWLLIVPSDELPAMSRRLRMYVLRAAVEIEELAGSWAVIGLAGDAAPARGDAGRPAPGVSRWRIAERPTLAYACGPREAIATLWREIDAPAVDVARWDGFEIDALRPRVVAPLSGRFLPQELDLERLQAVHFDKGCYPGQEIIARLRYRGKVKRGLFRARTHGPAAPGDKLYAEGANTSVGDVLRTAPDTHGGSSLLLVLDFDAAGRPLHLGEPHGPAVALRT